LSVEYAAALLNLLDPLSGPISEQHGSGKDAATTLHVPFGLSSNSTLLNAIAA
jgi:hypothetical protein